MYVFKDFKVYLALTFIWIFKQTYTYLQQHMKARKWLRIYDSPCANICSHLSYLQHIK